MRSIELTLAILRHLPPNDQVQVVAYIDRLHQATRLERTDALRKTAGCLTTKEAADMNRAISESCEQVDE